MRFVWSEIELAAVGVDAKELSRYALRVAFLLLMALGASSCCMLRRDPPPAPVIKGHVVMVHGIFEAGRSFTCLRHDLHARGYACHIPFLKPADARHGLEDLSDQLAAAIDERIPAGEKYTLVAFSMGGLIARDYLERQDHAARCKGLITLSTPHQGTIWAYGYPGQGARQMQPGSTYLKVLDKYADRLKPMPLYAFDDPLDVAILPPGSARWPLAVPKRSWAPFHFLVVFWPQTRRDIVDIVEEIHASSE